MKRAYGSITLIKRFASPTIILTLKMQSIYFTCNG